jgi:hypothetical protein
MSADWCLTRQRAFLSTRGDGDRDETAEARRLSNCDSRPRMPRLQTNRRFEILHSRPPPRVKAHPGGDHEDRRGARHRRSAPTSRAAGSPRGADRVSAPGKLRRGAGRSAGVSLSRDDAGHPTWHDRLGSPGERRCSARAWDRRRHGRRVCAGPRRGAENRQARSRKAPQHHLRPEGMTLGRGKGETT